MSDTDKTEQDWWQQVEHDPMSAGTLLVFADWLEEHDNASVARALRWCVQQGKRPSKGSDGMFYWHDQRSGYSGGTIPSVIAGVISWSFADLREAYCWLAEQFELIRQVMAL